MITKLKNVLLTFLVVFTVLLFSPVMAKADVNYPSATSQSYIEIVAQKTVKVYRYSSLSARGTSSPAKSYNAYASKGDVVYVYSVNSSVCYISYPVGSSRRMGYCSTSSLFLLSRANRVITSKGACTVYKYSTGTSYGSIAKNDRVYCIGTADDKLFVVYTARSGRRAYKCGWIRMSDYEKINSASEYVSIENGTYKITTALNSNYALDVNNYATFNGGNVEIYPYHNTNNEKWRITSLGNGYYRIVDCNSGKSLDVNGASAASGTNVQIWENNDSNAQKWRFVSAGNGYYYIVNANGCYLDVRDARVQNGNNVWVYTGNGSNAQKWRLTSVSVNNSQSLASPVPNGAKFNKKTNDGSWFGYHDINRNVSIGTPVYAISDGEITCKQAYRTYSGLQYLTSYGNYIEFRSNDGIYTAKYCHLNSFRNVSQRISSSRTKRVSGSTGTYILTTRKVSRGEIIGYIGNTGNSSGPHLHFELRKNGYRIDPTSVISGLI